MTANPKPMPVEISRANVHDVRVRWNDGTENVFEARALRLACSCAACVDEMTGRRILEEGSVPSDVHPRRISPVGNYAIHIDWSDGHGSGIYGFEYLKQLAGGSR